MKEVHAAKIWVRRKIEKKNKKSRVIAELAMATEVMTMMMITIRIMIMRRAKMGPNRIRTKEIVKTDANLIRTKSAAGSKSDK